MYEIFFVLSICVITEARYPVLVVSFDGFRADKLQEFIQTNPNSSFARIRKNSTYSDFMEPSFPSSTFPNHITLVTGEILIKTKKNKTSLKTIVLFKFVGLNPESHGIVQNAFYDPNYKQVVRLTKNNEEQWWNQSDPIWITAKKHVCFKFIKQISLF